MREPPNIQIGTAVKAPEMFLCPSCGCLNAMSDGQKARYGLAPTVVFECINCRAHVRFHRSSEQFEVRG